jgi:ATP phosphoribosyltransferase regulatory subunit
MYKYNVNTPEGTRDRVFSECRFRRQTEKAITGVFENRGYSEIITPEVEFYDLFVQSGNPLPQESMVKVIDRSGKILVMRPDNTTPVARVAATLLRGSGGAKRLYYNQTVFRSDDAHSGSESEIPSAGIELIGTNGMEADLGGGFSPGIEALEAAGAVRLPHRVGPCGILERRSPRPSL